MNADPLAAILERHSCRAFRSDPIPEGDLDRLIECLRWSPSAGNMQPWRPLVIRSAELRKKLTHAAHDQEFLASAPIGVPAGDSPGRPRRPRAEIVEIL